MTHSSALPEKVGPDRSGPWGGCQFSMSKIAVLTLVPWQAKVSAGRSSYHPPEFSAKGFKVVCCRGPFAYCPEFFALSIFRHIQEGCW
jgi:hypothetical protein